MSAPITSFRGKYHFLSNFYLALCIWNEQPYATAEHAFQAAKAVDEWSRKQVQNAPTPGKAKAIGRQIVKRDDWEQIKQEVMLDVLRSKFAEPGLGDQLMATKDAMIIEGNNWHDQEWGSCICPTHEKIAGKNLLGNTLMKVRRELYEGKRAERGGGDEPTS